jgi:malonyl-CoA O-methyltransferase
MNLQVRHLHDILKRYMSVGGHFERVAAVYESLRTTDEAPVRAIGQFLPDRPVTGLDIGCGTGRYTRLLRALLPDGSRLAASDVSAAMLAQLTAANRGHAGGVVPLLAAAEQLPLRAASLDLVTAFNCVHHFDLGRFLTAAARVLAPGGQLFLYTRTPQQNARTIWGATSRVSPSTSSACTARPRSATPSTEPAGSR